MVKKQEVSIKLKNTKLAKKKARVLPKKDKRKQEITATQSQWEIMGSTDRKLSTRHLMFVLEYCVDYNATRAYMEVYKVNQEIAFRCGPRLLDNVGVKQAIAKYMLPKIEKLWLWAERALRNLQAIVNKCMQLEPITKIIRYEKITTFVDDDWRPVTERDTQYREEEVKGDFNPAGAIAGVERITKLLNIDWWDTDSKKVQVISDKQKASMLALADYMKAPKE